MIVRAQVLFMPDIAEREVDGAVLLIARALAGFFFQCLEQLGRVFAQFGLRRAVAQLSNNPGGVPRGAAGQFLSLDQDRRNTALGQMVQRRSPNDAAANDDHRRLCRQGR